MDSSSHRNASADGFARSRPSSVGIDARALEEFLEALAAEKIDVHSLLLHRAGRIATEFYWWPYTADRPRQMHSIAKSFTACAVGMAIAEGCCALSDRVVEFFPEHLPHSPSENLTLMTVEDLLTMRTGHAQETSGSLWRGLRTSWIGEFFKIPVVHRPGSVYQYTSAASYMLSAIITRVTGETLHEYLRPRLFEPLGIHGESWDLGPDGINPGGNGLACKTVDVLKLGVLHQQRGVWQGRRLLPERWVAEATRPHTPRGYGYHWVCGPGGAACAMGKFGQLLTVFPEHDASVVMTAALNGAEACTRVLLPLIRRFFPRAFTDALTGDRAAEDRLEERARRAALPLALGPIPYPVDGRTGTYAYQFEPNALGLVSMRLALRASSLTLHLLDADGDHAIDVGIGRWIEGQTDIPGRDLHHGYDLRPTPVMAGATWCGADTLKMRWIFLESAFQDTVTLRFEGEQLGYSRAVNVNSGPLLQPPLHAWRLPA